MASVCVAGVLGGCSTSMVLIESLSKSGTNPMQLVTLATFIVVPLSAIIFTPNILQKRHISLESYAFLCLYFFATQVMNNQSVNYDIPFPLYIIFRSATLIASVILHWVLLRRTYSWIKIWSCVAVTVGIVMFTLASSRTPSVEHRIESMWIDYLPWPRFITGVITQTICVILSAYMGIKQEQIFGIYGKHSDEMMFYVHIISLPFFLVFLPDIWSSVIAFNESSIPSVFGISLVLPSLWWQLVAVCIIQIVCIRSVYRLTSVVSSLSVNMVLALRKFMSLFLSVYLFNNDLNSYHLIAAALIIGGSCAYYNVGSQLKTLLHSVISETKLRTVDSIKSKKEL